MNTLTHIFIRTDKTFEYLDQKQHNDQELLINSLFIFAALIPWSKEFLTNGLVTGYHFTWITAFFASVIASLVAGRYLYPYLLLLIAKGLKGKASITQIRLVLAFTCIPQLLTLPLIVYMGFLKASGQEPLFGYGFVNSFYLFAWLLSIKIFLQGIKKYNDFGFKETLLTVSPFVVIWIGFYIMLYFS